MTNKVCEICKLEYEGHGLSKTCSPECKKIKIKQDNKEYNKEYFKKPEVKARVLEYNRRPDVKERAKEYRKKYYNRPDIRVRNEEYQKNYRLRYAEKFGSRESTNSVVYDSIIKEWIKSYDCILKGTPYYVYLIKDTKNEI